MSIDVVRGADADALLDEDAFLDLWSDLCRRCPWATPFQGPDFGLAWYRSYRRQYEPLLMLSRDAGGCLDGLLALARVLPEPGRPGQAARLVVAGAWQAEYQAWICSPELADDFPRQVVDAVRREMPSAELRFRYLPPGIPVAWIDRFGLASTCALRPHRRPLMRFGDGSEIEASLRKGSNKSRLRRLEKQGAVEFRQFTSGAELDARFDEIIACHDVRDLAAHGCASFREDPYKRPFHLAMADAPGLLHATVTTVGGRVATAHLGASGGGEVQLGVIAHSPWFAKHSPGKFHIYFLARMLLEQGYRQLDLTAGGDLYKERFANAWDEVHTLDLLPASLARRAVVRVRKVTDRARAAASTVLAPAAARRPGSSRDARVYRLDLAATGVPPAPAQPDLVRRDELQDLLAYRPASWGPSRRRFISIALRRIEDGQHFYTWVEGDRLLHVAWLCGPRSATDAATMPEVPRPPDTALVHGLHTAREGRGRGLEELSLRTMLRDVAPVAGNGSVFVAVRSDDAEARRAVETIGFTYVSSPAQTTAPARP